MLITEWHGGQMVSTVPSQEATSPGFNYQVRFLCKFACLRTAGGNMQSGTFLQV